MRKYGYENKQMHELFFKVLEGHKPPNEEETLWGVMDYIQDFLDSCYWLGINPLREMRRMLPQYKWQFHRSEDKGLIVRTILGSQLIWRANWIDDDGPGEFAKEIQLVTAIKIEGASKLAGSLFFAGEKKKMESSTQKLNFVRTLGGNPVYSELLDEEWMRTPEGQKWLHTPIRKRGRS